MTIKPRRRSARLMPVFVLVMVAFSPATGVALETLRGHGETGLLFVAPPDKPACSINGAVTVPITRWNGLPIIEVHINDRRPYPLPLVTSFEMRWRRHFRC